MERTPVEAATLEKETLTLRKPLNWLALTGIALSLLGTQAGAQSYDFTSDYFAPGYTSLTTAVNGVWSSGTEHRQTVGGVEIPDSSTFTLPSNGYVDYGIIDVLGYVEHNPHPYAVSAGSQTWQPGAASIHGLGDGSYVAVRWTAPHAGTITLSSLFYDGDTHASTDVHVLENGTALFNGFKNGGGPDAGFSDTLTVQANDTIDFAVGYGADHDYSYDDNGLSANIAYTSVSPVPEANGAWSFGALAVSSLFWVSRLRKRGAVSK